MYHALKFEHNAQNYGDIINWSLEWGPVTVKHLIRVLMVCLISDFGQFSAVLIFFFFHYLRWFLYPSDLLQFHVTEYSVQFHMVLWDFRQLYLILYGSISFWQFHPFSIVSLIFLSVFVQFQPVIETGSLNLSSRQNILQTLKIYLSFYLIIHFFLLFIGRYYWRWYYFKCLNYRRIVETGMV